MRKSLPGSRHLRWKHFKSRINAGPPSLQVIPGTPHVNLFIERGGSQLGAVFHCSTTQLPTSRLSEITVRLVTGRGGDSIEISTGNRLIYRPFYSLCCEVSDRVQLEGEDCGRALSDSLQSWTALLRKKALLSSEQQVGLYGELLAIAKIASRIGWVRAVAAWQGPLSEEHDFVLHGVDIEVKTTTSERRIHAISSMSQLVPKLNRKLVVLSVQLTRGGEGQQGKSLPTLIAETISSASLESYQCAERIEEVLQGLGWELVDAGHYSASYLLRGPMMAIPVDARFPAINRGVLGTLGSAKLARISEVQYCVDVEGLGAKEGTSHFNKYILGKH